MSRDLGKTLKFIESDTVNMTVIVWKENKMYQADQHAQTSSRAYIL